MPIYKSGEPELVAFIAEVMGRLHGRLADVELVIDVLEARPKTDEAGEPVGDALKLHGYPCYATIKIRGPKDRGAGLGDALLTIDAYRWPELSDATKTALIDHELTHLELCVDDEGRVKRDDYDRPRLRLRLHDQQFGWFDEVANRHDAASIEVQQLRAFCDHSGQYYLPGFTIPPRDGSSPERHADAFKEEVRDTLRASGIDVITFTAGNKSATLQRRNKRSSN